MNRWSLLIVSASAAVCSTITGCAQTGVKLPSIGRVFDIAKESAREPATWVPFTAAAVLGVTGADDSVSDWAADNTPVFGSQNSADDASGDLKNALLLGMAVTSIVAPTPVEDSTFLVRRVAANVLAMGRVISIVAIGKQITGRDRPNGRNDDSFPSAHSSTAFSSAILIEKNLNETIEIPWLRKTIKYGTQGTAAAVAWARVEAEENHAVDVLFSAALSNLVVKTVYRSIVTEGKSVAPPVAIEASRDGFSFQLSHTF